MSADTLLVLETIEEASYFVNHLLVRDERFRGCRILSLEPNIQALLAANDIKSISSAEFTDIHFYHPIMDKCEELEKYIRECIERRDIALPEKYFVDAFWHYLRLIWRHLLWNIEVLDRCLKADAYKQVFTFKYRHVVTLSPWIEDDQLFMGDLAEQLCKIKGIDFIPLDLPSEPLTRLQREAQMGWFSKLCNQISVFLLRIAASAFSPKKSTLVPNFGYSMNLVCDEIVSADRDVKISTFYLGKNGILELVHALGLLSHAIFTKKIKRASITYAVDFAFPIMTFARYYSDSYEDAVEGQYMKAVVEALENGGEKKGNFRGVNIANIIKEKVAYDLAPYMLDSNFQAFGLAKGIETVRPTCVLSQMNFELCCALGHIAKKLDIPSVLISHGSHVLHQEKYASREHKILAENILVGDYRYLAVQSPYAKEIALRLTEDPNKVVNIKPTLWGRAVSKNSSDKADTLTIVHAGTFKLRHNRRYIYEAADEYLKTLKELCEIVSTLPRLRLIVTARLSGYELSLETLKMFLPPAENIVVVTKKPFADLLKAADLVMSFSSTTIEEALSNKIPVLLYGGSGRYSHIPVMPFSDANKDILKPVTFVADKDGLRKYLTQLNQMGDSFAVSEDKFNGYHFSDEEVVDFTKWFLGLQRMSA